LSNLRIHALTEFRAAGWVDEHGIYMDEMQEMICTHVLDLLDVFADEGHSGSTAPYAINMFARLAKFEPIAPLTGEDWEWNEVSERMGNKCWQNKRASHVFKDETGAYDINGKVFWEWAVSYNDDGKEDGIHKSYYTSRDSRVPVTFPYVVPEKPIYEYRYSDATPQQPPQDENGFIN
jgi:hypothetical protein